MIVKAWRRGIETIGPRASFIQAIPLGRVQVHKGVIAGQAWGQVRVLVTAGGSTTKVTMSGATNRWGDNRWGDCRGVQLRI